MKKFYPYLLFALLLFTNYQSKAQDQVNKSDSLALVDLYNSTDGAHWKNNANWLTSAYLFTWYGVVYDFDSNGVQTLNLESNNLNGTIPSSLGKLQSLFDLYLYDNKLQGTIPANLGNLVNLKILDLSLNHLSGTIPLKLSNLTNLITLNLVGNNLSGGIPADLGKLSNLISLYLNNNSLSGVIPAALGTANNKLHTINLSNNYLKGSIPTELGNLRTLYSLNLGFNNLTGTIPVSLAQITGLQYLSLNNNKLSGNIPFQFGGSHVTSLVLNDNRLAGKIPSALDSASFTTFNVSNNKLKGEIPLFVKSRNLYQLHLDSNRFNFDGLEAIAAKYAFATYSSQANLTITQNGNLLSVDAGGTISNNTYKWYRNGKQYRTKTGNANLTASNDGAYTVEVTNAVATKLTFKTDTVNYPAFNNVVTAATGNTIKPAYIFPNPATTTANVYFMATGKYSVTITGVSGKVLQTNTGVATNNQNFIQLDISRFASGIYLINISDEKGYTQTLKLNKQ